jgi:parallel beta-helix repeat protein
VTGIGPTDLIAQNGIQFYDAAAGTISGDTVSANSYTESSVVAVGLLLYSTGTLNVTDNTVTANDVNAYLIDDGTGPTEGAWTISGNTVTDGADNANTAGFGDGIDVDSTSNAVSITGNTVTGGANNGISLFSTTNATVSNNTTSNNRGDGIYVGGPGSTQTGNASDNTVSNNTSSKNGQDGILADTDSSANTFSGNILKKDVRYDIEDLSTGTGSGGTANTWSGGTCKPMNDSSPSGLCG